MTRTDGTDLDTALARWARGGPELASEDEAALLSRLEMHAEATAALERPELLPRTRWRAGLVAGGALAASVALALLFLRPEPMTAPAPGAAAVPGDPAASFALLYTPTTDEEYPL
jgi:hypothetical protein